MNDNEEKNLPFIDIDRLKSNIYAYTLWELW